MITRKKRRVSFKIIQKTLCRPASSWFNCPACFHRKSNRSILSASAARPWRPPPRPCRTKGFAVTGSDQNVYPPMSTFLADRKIEAMNGYAERNLAHKPDLVVIGNAISRGNPEAEFVLDHKLRYCSLPELLKEFFIRGKRSIVVCRHARQDHDDVAAGVGIRAQRAEPGLSSSAASRTTSARARGSRTANGSSSRATNTTRHFSTSAASSSITSRKSASSTTSSSITRTSLKTWTRSKKRSRISSGSFRATACCSATATTRTSLHCSM